MTGINECDRKEWWWVVRENQVLKHGGQKGPTKCLATLRRLKIASQSATTSGPTISHTRHCPPVCKTICMNAPHEFIEFGCSLPSSGDRTEDSYKILYQRPCSSSHSPLIISILVRATACQHDCQHQYQRAEDGPREYRQLDPSAHNQFVADGMLLSEETRRPKSDQANR
jgi:hypothetical protein